ncbi:MULTISPECIES: response regulator transcription factor [Vibrio]|uniref:response regulator transcription factor n=1 Tax=Vibrio TaxID=662 RepID=UPI00102DA75D|nr:MULTISPECIES: response regulator transcription factor [Vibrio]MCF7509485.1 response regulator transcription factor [Vibrio sp. D54]RZV16135.1 response regulator transcription factor [Vibrio alginolyticus]
MKNTNQLRCFVVDDHPLICAAIESLLKKSELFSVVESACDTTEAHTYLKSNQVDLLILDVNLETSDGFEFLKRARIYGYKGKVLYVSANNARFYSETAFNIGADGYVCKSDRMGLILDAVEAVISGYHFFKFVSQVDPTDRGTDVKLSNREAIVFQYLTEGKSNKEIAELMFLSQKTISTYKTRILDKFKVKSIVELMGLRDSVLNKY